MRASVAAGTIASTAVTAALALTLLTAGTRAADHLDAPDLTPPGGNLMADIADLYVFPAPGMPNQVVLAATFNPAAGIFGPAGFDPSVTYSFHVTEGADPASATSYEVSFGALDAAGRQSFEVVNDGEALGSGTTGVPTKIVGGNGRAFAGLVDDPFFFDLDAFLGSGGRAFCDGNEADFFAGLNVNTIVMQIDAGAFGAGPMGVWVSTTGASGQVDRMGFPAINTVFIPKNRKERYNEAQPAGDEDAFFRFLRRGFRAGGNDAATSRGLADFLLPDILPYDHAAPAGFLNGRRLQDDVIDAELGLLTAGALTGDCVPANDVPFRDAFPYLGVAH